MKPSIPVTLTLAIAAAAITGQQAASATTLAPTTSAMQAVHTPLRDAQLRIRQPRVRRQLPVSSDRTAYDIIGCTTDAGLSRSNAEANVTTGGLAHVQGAVTKLWTTRSGGQVTSWARESIAEVTIGHGIGGALTLRGITSTSKAMYNGTRYVTAPTSFDRLHLLRAAGSAGSDSRSPRS